MMDVTRTHSSIHSCTACPRLRSYCQSIARVKRKAYLDQNYWGKPVSGFGDPKARLLIVGLAPGAHGANRTGRVFTGDRSGEWLYRALYEYGFANQPNSDHRDDGLALQDAYITCTVKCAPPENRPRPDEFQKCVRFFQEELEALPQVKVYLALGKIAYDALWRELELGKKGKPKFQHGLEISFDRLGRKNYLLLSFHPSQQNTFTGVLTQPMFHSVFARAKDLLEKDR